MNEEQLFAAALEKATPQERAAFLDLACAGNPQLRAQVEALLEAHANPDSFLNPSPPSPLGGEGLGVRGLGATLDVSTPEATGMIIGPYKLLEQIGEGGMGTVYMAQQTEPVKRVVALKLIKPGMDSKQVIARFEAERQALALMDHANIAKVFDAGATPSGRPYFVMELVKGVPITKYCDEHHLTPRQRLELFIPACQAIQHAHQKGIIHRDLKPSNVLVAPYDGKPVPKVIDFGVAKATGQQLTDRTLVTGFGAIVGTLEYMSPEQAEINQLDIDTRSDIYSLGVLLYELLTGSTPFTKKDFEKAGMLEMLRMIREQEPSKPSMKLSTAEGLPTLAANRGTEPAKLTKLVRGELDWIVMKALEKDRNRRYETANGFAMDVQRYLADEPVLACPPSMRYRLRKFARRNKAALVTVALIAVVLVAGSVVSTWQAIRATRAETETDLKRAEAEASHQKARQAIQEYFTLVSETKLLNVPGLQPLRKQLLDAALRYYREMAEKRDTDPMALADVAAAFLRVAIVCHEVNRNDDSLAAIDAGLDAVERLRHDHPQARDAILQLAGFYNVIRPMSRQTEMPKDVPAAERTLNRYVRVWEALAAEHPEVEGFQNDLGYITAMAGALQGGIGAAGDKTAFPRAIALFSKSAALSERLSLAHPKEVRYAENYAQTQDTLVWLLNQVGQTAEAEAMMDRMLTVYEKFAVQYPQIPVYHEYLGRTLIAVAHRLHRDGKNAEALAKGRRAFDILADLARQFPVIRSHSDQLANSLKLLTVLSPKSLPEAMSTIDKIIQKRPNDGELLLIRGRWHLQNQQLQKGASDLARSLELTHPEFVRPVRRLELANAYEALKQDAAALAELTQATQQAPDLWDTWAWRAMYHFRRQQWPSAIADFSKAVELRPDYLDGLYHRGVAHAALKEWDKAIADQTKAIQLDPKMWGAWHQRGLCYANLEQWGKTLADYSKVVELAPALALDLVQGLQAAGRKSDAEKLARDAIANFKKLTKQSPGEAEHWYRLGQIHNGLGEHDEAVACMSKALELKPDLNVPNPYPWEVWNHRGFARAMLGKYDEAVADYTTAIKLSPNHVLNWHRRGLAYSALKQWDKAILDFTKAIELGGVDPGIWAERGRAYLASGQPEQALADLAKAIDIAPKNGAVAWWRLDRANAFAKLKQDDKALAELSKAIEERPELLDAWFWRAMFHRNRKNWDQAVADYSKVLELKPDLWNGWYARGWIQARQGKWEKALSDLAKAVELNPKNASVNNDLAWFLATCPDAKLRDPKRAVESAKNAVQLAPDNANIRNTLGAAHYRAGNYQAAVATLEKAIELNKEGTVFDWLFLAMAHHKLGDKEAARKWFDKAAAWLENNPKAFVNDPIHAAEVQRFRAEAEEVLGIKK